MGSAITIRLPKFHWGIENSFVKKNELLIAAYPVCINSTSLNKALIAVRWLVFCNFGIKMNVEMFP